MTTIDTRPLFRGQFRVKGSRRWQTFCERPSESPCWDEMLTAKELAGHDLRVVPAVPETNRRASLYASPGHATLANLPQQAGSSTPARNRQ